MTRPGLAKARGLPLLVSRPVVLVRTNDARWRELFERADIVSEGSARAEGTGAIWYGSTSMLLSPSEHEMTLLATLAERDLHVRLRAVRMARREACLRAPGGLGPLTCEMRVLGETHHVRIDVDVQAPLIERRSRPRTAPATSPA